MKVLIIGGRGYIGSCLFTHLTNQGVDVQIFGDRQQDYNILGRIFLSHFTHIILLAGHSSVLRCNGPLESSWKNNVRNFKNLVDKTDNRQTIIYASSASVYGDKDTKPLYTEEDMSVDYVNNYDLTKVSLDLLAMKYISNGRQIVGLRFGTVNGGSSVIRRDLMINSMVYSSIQQGSITITNKHIKRPILSTRDLSRAVETIIKSNLKSGIFNLFNNLYKLYYDKELMINEIYNNFEFCVINACYYNIEELKNILKIKKIKKPLEVTLYLNLNNKNFEKIHNIIKEN